MTIKYQRIPKEPGLLNSIRGNTIDVHKCGCVCNVCPLWFWLAVVSFLSISFTGCHGYLPGSRSLYNKEIKTVYVPMVESNSYRGGLGERLTESLCKKITQRTPFLLSDPQRADSVLAVQIIAENTRVAALNKYNDTREKTFTWCITATWTDRRKNVIAKLDPIPLSSLGVTINSDSYLVAEMGQSGAVSQQDLIDKIADQIVGLMEEPW